MVCNLCTRLDLLMRLSESQAREAAAQRVAAVGEALFAKKKKVSSVCGNGQQSENGCRPGTHCFPIYSRRFNPGEVSCSTYRVRVKSLLLAFGAFDNSE